MGKRLGKSVRDAAYLAAGAGAAQAVALLAVPLLTRLYRPEDFGALALYSAASGFLIAIGVGRYEMAIVLAPGRREAAVLLKLCFSLVLGTSALTLVGVLVLMPWYLRSDLGRSLDMWILLLPLSVLVGAGTEVLINDATRTDRFRLIGSVTVIKELASSGMKLLFGATRALPGASGLILGTVIGISAGSLRLGRDPIHLVRSVRPGWSDVASAAKEYSKFPKFNLPATIGRSAVLFGIPVIIGSLFGAATLGIWSIAYKFVMLPGNLVGSAMGRSYYRESAAILHTGGSTRRYFDRTVITLVLLALPAFALIAIAAERVFGALLGQEWAVAGSYARLMLPSVAVQFVWTAVASTAQSHGKNQISLVASVAQLICVAATVLVSLALGWGIREFLLTLSISMGVIGVMMLLLLRSVTTREPPRRR